MNRISKTAKEFDARHDAGNDISEYIDTSAIRRPGLEARRVNPDVPVHIPNQLTEETLRKSRSGKEVEEFSSLDEMVATSVRRMGD